MSLVPGDGDDYEPAKVEPAKSDEYQRRHLQIIMEQAGAERESWDDYKQREKKKLQEETDKMNMEEKWREEHRAQLDRDRARLLKRGTNHKCVHLWRNTVALVRWLLAARCGMRGAAAYSLR
jgi:hypothetical protein